jgi:hypothetical protein
MTRSLQWAGIGLCALLLPACKGAGDSTEAAYSSANPPVLVVNRPPGTAPAGSREQIAQGLGGPGSNDVALSTAPTSGVVAVGLPELPPSPPSSPSPPGDLAAPAGPPIANQAANGQMAVVAPPILEPQAADEIKQASLPPSAEAPPEDPIRRPEWPRLGIPAANSADRPEYLPQAEPTPTGPSSSRTIPLTPPADVAPVPAPAAPAQSSTSLKVVEPLAVSQAPTHNETILMQALGAFQNNRPAEAAEILKHLGAINQEVLMCLMPLLVRLGEGNVNNLPPDELAMSIDQLQTASMLLKSKAALRIDNACFCRGVRKFADVDLYEPRHEFRTGDMVFLYAELKNFTCSPVAAAGPYNSNQRGFNIQLATRLEMRDSRNSLVWLTDLNKNDFTQTPPQDYYHTYRFCVPEKIPAGTYTLWLIIVDKPTGRTVRKPIELRVGQS